MKWITALLVGAMMVASGCTSDPEGINNPGGNSGGGQSQPLGGYAAPDGVLILNQGAPRLENGSVTWISPEGIVEQNVYRTVNGSACGNTSQDLYLCGNKIYIMSNNNEVPDLGNSEPGDGSIVIVDAETFRREKAFQFSDLKFHKPEGSLEVVDSLSLATPFENMAVIDEHNLFFADGQGMFRLDTETGKLNLVEGGYHFGNQGNTIETVVATRGMTVIGDHLYFAAGTLTVSRISLKTWKIEEYIHVENDAPQARYLTCNVVADSKKNLLYVSVSNDLNEARTSDGNILVYNCSGDEPQLVMNIENKASYPINIYPMSKFY